MADTYSGAFGCSNCGWEGSMEVEKGTTLKEAAGDTDCPNCGCDNTVFYYAA